MKLRPSSHTLLLTVFQASVWSYVVFWLADAIRPGFVARTFSVHIFGALALLSGLVLASSPTERRVHRLTRVLVPVMSALVGLVFFWQIGQGLGTIRVWLAVLGSVVCTVVSIRSVSDSV